jgi:hypothetical protein
MGRLIVIDSTVTTVKIAKFQVVALALLIPETGQGYARQPDSRGRNYYDMRHSQAPDYTGHFLGKKHLWLP